MISTVEIASIACFIVGGVLIILTTGACAVTATRVLCQFTERFFAEWNYGPFSSAQWSQKCADPGLHCEIVALSQAGWIAMINGPYPCGDW